MVPAKPECAAQGTDRKRDRRKTRFQDGPGSVFSRGVRGNGSDRVKLPDPTGIPWQSSDTRNKAGSTRAWVIVHITEPGPGGVSVKRFAAEASTAEYRANPDGVPAKPERNVRRRGRTESGSQGNEAPGWPRIGFFGWGDGLGIGEDSRSSLHPLAALRHPGTG